MARGPIFLSYRRTDTSGHAGRIYDRIATRFPGRVFRDLEALTPGVDFVQEIDRRVATAAAMVVVIGPTWASERLFAEDDFVRLEVRSALKRNIPTIPVLVLDAELPALDVLPPDLHLLRRRQALSVREDAFDAGMQKLIVALEGALGEAPPKPPRPAPSGKGGATTGIVVGSVVAIGLCCGTLAFLSQALTEFSNRMEETIQEQLANNTTIVPPPAPAGEAPPVAPGPIAAEPAFRPTGAWRVQAPNGAVFVTMHLHPDSSFRTDTQVAGMTMPASLGQWSYVEATHTLSLAGVDNQQLPFVNLIQITEFHGDPSAHWHATSPQYGQLEFWPAQ